MIRRLPPLRSAQELASLVNEIGFLPFFANPIPGFSIEEATPGELWFADDADGPWEWKDPAIRAANCAYGKFYQGRAMYISAEWFADFCNYRRDGYDFEGFYEDGFARKRDKRILDALNELGPAQARDLKREARLDRDERRGFDGMLTRLQMQTFLLIDGIEYRRDRLGKVYGWGVCRYATPEQRFGEDFLSAAYERPGEESATRILQHLQKLLPDAEGDALAQLLGRPATGH